MSIRYRFSPYDPIGLSSVFPTFPFQLLSFFFLWIIAGIAIGLTWIVYFPCKRATLNPRNERFRNHDLRRLLSNLFALSPCFSKIRRKLFKTKLCVLYQRGRCSRRSCSFAHGDADLRGVSGSYGERIVLIGYDTSFPFLFKSEDTVSPPFETGKKAVLLFYIMFLILFFVMVKEAIEMVT
ncbi:hypothetical protein V6N12_012040 [Hibiscus sabdariffa]|uniref:C3H1-type domain-containing protein n=1 Tax=Hibiscus sabdariffa TaxID=183260 RepID=A0ABR2CGY8_9ROSI